MGLLQLQTSGIVARRTYQQGVPLDLQLDFPTLAHADQFEQGLVENQRLAVTDLGQCLDHDGVSASVITQF